jgi:hypothetical protein
MNEHLTAICITALFSTCAKIEAFMGLGIFRSGT